MLHGAEVHYDLGIAYRSRGDREPAIRYYNNTLRLRPGWELPSRALEQISKEPTSAENLKGLRKEPVHELLQ